MFLRKKIKKPLSITFSFILLLSHVGRSIAFANVIEPLQTDPEIIEVTNREDVNEIDMAETTALLDMLDIPVVKAGVDVETEIISEEIIEETVIEESSDDSLQVDVSEPLLSHDEIALIALVTMAEAEGESELGKRLVIDVILNRVDSEYFPNTVHDVIYAKGQFEAMWNGRINRCVVREDIYQLVEEEMINRTNSEVLYFRMKYYHSFGTPILQEGNHYFSTY